jgi:RNA polymerase sigma-70 factor (ECF subfamily)
VPDADLLARFVEMIAWLVGDCGSKPMDASRLMSACPDFPRDVYQRCRLGKPSFVAGAELPKRYPPPNPGPARLAEGSPTPLAILPDSLFFLPHLAPFCAIRWEGTVMSTDTERLLRRVADGDGAARDQLLERYRGRLRRMVLVRFDPRLTARVDPSDVVQETLAEAAAGLDRYLRERPLPFYPWLRQVAQRRLIHLYRWHVQAQRRSVTCEEAPVGLPDRSALALAERLFCRHPSPSAGLHRQERRERVRAALAALAEQDREVLVLRILEGLPTRETAAVLRISEVAVRSRQVRALERLKALLGPDFLEGEQ